MNDIKVQLKNIVKEFSGRGDDANVQAVNDVSMTIYNGEFFAMLGPSGCGKTTTLRLIAGFEQPTRGEILIDGQPVQGIPAYRRPVNTVFQDYALFPHMTVLQNVMFGLKMAGVARKEAESRARSALEMVRLPQIANRKPSELSGGQQQRVALARALVNKPSVLLLDEPLGALDLKLRREMQIELKQMQKELGITFVFVTHDQEEAMTMANRIAVMDQGRVLQVGRPDEIYETPVNRFVADFIGETNFLNGRLVEHNGANGDVRLADGTLVKATLGDPSIHTEAQVTVAIRPERIFLKPTDASGNGAHPTPDQTHLIGEIAQTSYLGTDTRYIVRLPDASHVTVRVQNTGYQHDALYSDGQKVNILWENANARILGG